MRSIRFQRRGCGLIAALAMLVLVMLAPVMMARQRQGSRAIGSVTRSNRGEVLFDVGRAALAEAWWQLERRASDPTDSLFRTLRSAQTADTSTTLDVSHLALELQQNPLLAGVKVKDGLVRATISPLVNLGNDPPEGTAKALLEVTVTRASGTPVRVLRESRELRVLLVSVPRPFDRYALVVIDATDLIGTETNDWIKEARREIVRLADHTREKIRALGGSVSDLPARNRRLLDPAPDLTTDLSRGLHLFPTPCALASTSTASLDLTKLSLLPILEDTRREISAAREDYDQADASDPSDEDGLRSLADKGTRLSKAYRKLLEQVTTYQDTWPELGDADARALSTGAERLDVSAWKRRGTFRFEGDGAARRCLEMLDAYAQEDPPRPVSGTIVLDNPDATLRMSNRKISGRLVIVATGDVDLTDVDLSDPATDLLVVQAKGKIHVAGKVKAALIARGDLDLDADAVVHGAVIMDDAPSADRLAGLLDGEIDRFSAGTSGAERDQMRLALLAPWADSREVDAE